MGFRYDTRHLRPDQQAIISQKDDEIKRRRVEAEVNRQKQEFYEIEKLVNDSWAYDGSLEDGNSINIHLKLGSEKKTIVLKIKDNILKAKKLFGIGETT